MNGRRLKVLIQKERKQLFRDPINIVIGILLPIILLVVIGYGMSFDIKNIRLAVVEPDRSDFSSDLLARFAGSEYFKVERFTDTAGAVQAIRDHRVDAALILPQNAQRELNGGTLELMIVVNADNPSQAILKENYLKSIITGVIGQTLAIHSQVSMIPRMFFNDNAESLFFMIPGLIVIIITMLGTMLTCMLLAREYEHGNLESMFVTPMQSLEILIAKALSNFTLGLIGIAITLFSVKYLFHMPVRGSVLLLATGCALYLLLALAIGLLISSFTKSQFFACQVTMVVTFLPSVMLSGFVYEIANLPPVVQYITALFPARYLIDFLQTVFLIGNDWRLVLPDLLIIAGFTVVITWLAVRKAPKSLE